MGENEVPSGYTRVPGYEKLGSVGDLRVRYLQEVRRKSGSRIWVIGCFDNSHLAFAGEESSRSELFALVLGVIRLEISAMRSQAKACCCDGWRRIAALLHRMFR